MVTSTPTVYSVDFSPPCRAVLMTGKALGLDFNVKECNPIAGQHLTPEYVKINPQHTIPTLIDGELTLGDSHAINIYLVEKYGKNDSLYPKDLLKRATVNQRLFFDDGIAFAVLLDTIKYYLVPKKGFIPDTNKARAKEVYEFVEKFLEGQGWVAGNDLTIADIQLLSTITSMNVIFPMEEDLYPNIKVWLEKCRLLPFYEENARGLEMYKKTMVPLLPKA